MGYKMGNAMVVTSQSQGNHALNHTVFTLNGTIIYERNGVEVEP